MPQIQTTITHSDGSTDALDGVQSQETREFDKEDMATIHVERSDANDVDLTEGVDEVVLTVDGEDSFGGILRDINRGGSTAELVVESYERLARNAEPTPGGERWGDERDDDIIEDAIQGVPDLSAGTLDHIEDGLTFVFSHTSPAKKIRTVTDATTGIVQYNPDKTVDYRGLAVVGTERTEVLSPSSQTVVDGFEVRREGGEEYVTHLRMLGAGEGDAQVQTTVISDEWAEGDPKSWDTRTNKDVTDEGVLQKQGEVLIAELNEDHLEVETTVEGVDVALGDQFLVQHTQEQIDQEMRVVEHTRVTTADGVTHQVTLSSRTKARKRQYEKEVKDLERYNKAFEGTSVTMNTGGGRQPVDGGHNYQFDVYYPDEVAYEHRVMLRVKGLPYRAYSQGAASGGGEHSHSIEFSIDSHTHHVDVTDHIHTVPLSTTSANSAADSSNIDPIARTVANPSSSWEFEETFDWPGVAGSATTGIVFAHLAAHDPGTDIGEPFSTAGVTMESGGTQFFKSFEDQSPSETIRNANSRHWNVVHTADDMSGEAVSVTFEGSIFTGSPEFYYDVSAIVIGDHDHEVEETMTSEADGAFSESTSDGGGSTEVQTTTNATGLHAHPADPGIQEVFDGTTYYPKDCQVIVNGVDVGGAFGDGTGPFQETVDLAGELQPGKWNTIEVSSAELGHLQAHLDVDVYRQILGGG